MTTVRTNPRSQTDLLRFENGVFFGVTEGKYFAVHAHKVHHVELKTYPEYGDAGHVVQIVLTPSGSAGYETFMPTHEAAKVVFGLYVKYMKENAPRS